MMSSGSPSVLSTLGHVGNLLRAASALLSSIHPSDSESLPIRGIYESVQLIARECDDVIGRTRETMPIRIISTDPMDTIEIISPSVRMPPGPGDPSSSTSSAPVRQRPRPISPPNFQDDEASKKKTTSKRQSRHVEPETVLGLNTEPMNPLDTVYHRIVGNVPQLTTSMKALTSKPRRISPPRPLEEERRRKTDESRRQKEKDEQKKKKEAEEEARRREELRNLNDQLQAIDHQITTLRRIPRRTLEDETPKRPSKGCSYCTSPRHYSDACPLATLEQRLAMVANLGLCSICISNHGQAERCSMQGSRCRYCEETTHHSSICLLPIKVPIELAQAEIKAADLRMRISSCSTHPAAASSSHLHGSPRPSGSRDADSRSSDRTRSRDNSKKERASDAEKSSKRSDSSSAKRPRLSDPTRR